MPIRITWRRTVFATAARNVSSRPQLKETFSIRSYFFPSSAFRTSGTVGPRPLGYCSVRRIGRPSVPAASMAILKFFSDRAYSSLSMAGTRRSCTSTTTSTASSLFRTLLIECAASPSPVATEDALVERRQRLEPVRGHQVRVLEPHGALPREDEFRLEGEHHAGREDRGGPLRDEGELVHLDPDPVADELCIIPRRAHEILRERRGGRYGKPGGIKVSRHGARTDLRLDRPQHGDGAAVRLLHLRVHQADA